MTAPTIKKLDDGRQRPLRSAAELHDQTVKEELGAMKHAAPAQRPQAAGLGDRIHQRFAALGGVELNLPARTEQIRMVDLPE